MGIARDRVVAAPTAMLIWPDGSVGLGGQLDSNGDGRDDHRVWAIAAGFKGSYPPHSGLFEGGVD